MNAIVLLPKGFDKLYAYDTNGVLKGVTTSQVVNGVSLSFITLYGENAERLVFTIGDGFTKKTTTKSIVFKGNDVLGTLLNPIILEDVSNGTTVYPNPFQTSINIQVMANKKQEVTIQLFTTAHQLVFIKKAQVENGHTEIEIVPNVAQGIYILQAEIDGQLQIFKVIKN